MTLQFAPALEDLRFLLHEVLRAETTLAQLGGIASTDAQTLDQLAEAIGRFAAEVVAPLNRGADHVGCRWVDGAVQSPPGFAQAYRDFCDLGWPAMCAPESEGGQGLPQLVFSMVQEMLSSASHAFVMAEAVNHCASACMRHSAPIELQQRWLPRLLDGSVLASMCLTEPQAGSDLGLIRTRAHPTPDGTYRITGEKIFASGAEHDLTRNIAHLVLARLPGALPGTRGLSLFLVPKLLEDDTRNTVYCDGIEQKMGLHGSPTCSMHFEGAVGWLLGREGEGLAAMFPMLNQARLLSGLQAVGMSEAALQASTAYARERRQGKGREGDLSTAIVAHADVRRMLLTQRAWTEGGRALAHWTALLMDVGDRHPKDAERRRVQELLGFLTPIVKAFLTENAQQSINLALQVHGGHGYVTETGIEQLVRDVRITTIYEGTTGIQSIDLLFRKAHGQGGVRLQHLTALVERWLDEARSNVRLAYFVAELGEALERWKVSTSLLRGSIDGDGRLAASGATAYLRLSGHVVFALLWAQMAEHALRRPQGDAFAGIKLATARFYYEHLLPETLQLERVLRASPQVLDEAFAAA